MSVDRMDIRNIKHGDSPSTFNLFEFTYKIYSILILARTFLQF